MKLTQALQCIKPPHRRAMEETKRRLDSIIKPLDSLGLLERHLVKIAGMTGRTRFDFSRKAVAVFCADNGVVARGISQSGKEVTAIVAENLTTGQTCVCNMARVAGADLFPVDVGIDSEHALPGLRNCKIARGTGDFTAGPAMSREQATAALEVGIDLALELKAAGYGLAAAGEMGIGNTTTSAALAAVLLELPSEAVAGRGAGLSREGMARKLAVIREGIALHQPDPGDPLGLLASLGGFDIAAMAGFCLGGAAAGLPVVLDGLISGVAALLAVGMAPLVKEYLLPAHVSAEPAGALLLDKLGLEAPLRAGMRLGEGTGAVATFPLYDMINAVYENMVVFGDENISPYERYS